ncbi:MarR family transcriptional regulator [Bacillus sp. Soil531]|uniref:MarR family winged helix-turn-helix transcriptional regulator n=1 Tax=Priestia megaterium TaxID=1404 RepID=UPI00070F85A2|nr:MarR family transcriptional regulator [Priestia megaterium]KRF46345.1 MarR family transcriptional regulator [Bacillus sp. Soil531]PGO53756.1 MarR family transcriptional regulator [Priestia megaterium]
MKNNQEIELLNTWLSITNIQSNINHELEMVLQENYKLSLKEFYVLYFLSQTDDKQLRLQQLQEMIGLSQSALSRLVGRLEAKSCGALQRHICEDDRRGIYTRLTPLGEEKLDGALQTFYQVLQSILGKEHLQREFHFLMGKI